MKSIFISICIVFALTGCEKVVDLKYQDNQSRIVIVGNITNEAGPYTVSITKSISLQDSGPYGTIDNAVVVITDDAGNSETLTPEGAGIYHTNSLIGVEGRKYSLSVLAEGQMYTAQSIMPQRVPLDSIRIDSIDVFGEIEYNLIPVYNDPIEKGNNYQFIISVNNQLINQHLLQNDEIKNGAVNTYPLQINDDDLKLKPGDNIPVTMQCIDKTVAAYFTALEQMADSGPGGGTTPNNPPGNISNGALGIFSAHTVETKSVTIQ